MAVFALEAVGVIDLERIRFAVLAFGCDAMSLPSRVIVADYLLDQAEAHEDEYLRGLAAGLLSRARGSRKVEWQ